MYAGKSILAFTLFLCFVFSVTAQKTKIQLQKEKQQNLQKIKEVEKILSETTTKKKNSLGELTALNQRILEQEKLIGSINNEIKLLNTEIDENNDFINSLEDDLKKLKTEYASMLFAAQKANNSVTRLTFLFSSNSFEQLMMRLRYMKQYSEKRKIQAKAITAVQEELAGQVKQIELRRTEKNVLLKDEVSENTNLTGLKKKQNTLVKSLEKEEKSLKRDLEDTRKALVALDNKINEIIKEEMERAAREAREAKTKSKSSTAAVTTATAALSSSFEENKHKFPWPVNGFISQVFGRQKHPLLKGVYIDNVGINIQTTENEKVSSIFQGEVNTVAFIQLLGNSVIITHGEYITVYSGLKEVFVKKGQKVKLGQEIGLVLSNSEGISELRFRIYKNTTALDPQQWLRN
ncbi:MAG TPA: peptidoglycan DD-metalloendopeptidase family protein [Cyclobacteriaceae bacterium]|nr:peptidoglycan DD-metalloendopeptidase family protein [Cyclobacteriaceae bacterium]